MEEFPSTFSSKELHKSLDKAKSKHYKKGDEVLAQVRERIVNIVNENIKQRNKYFTINYDILKPLDDHPPQRKTLILELFERFKKIEQRWVEWNYQTGVNDGKSETFTKNTKSVYFSDYKKIWVSL